MAAAHGRPKLKTAAGLEIMARRGVADRIIRDAHHDRP